jgi:hypothetical protein
MGCGWSRIYLLLRLMPENLKTIFRYNIYIYLLKAQGLGFFNNFFTDLYKKKDTTVADISVVDGYVDSSSRKICRPCCRRRLAGTARARIRGGGTTVSL